MALPSFLETWASIYANHPALRTAIVYMHVGGLVVGGGAAIAADRVTLRAARQPVGTRRPQLDTLHDTHRVVVASLGMVMASGVLMFGSDADNFIHSKVFWLKMAMTALLLLNGTFILRAERRIEHGDQGGWGPLAFTSVASLALWLLTTLAGAALPNVG